jgi:mono/diheme cytochrome c family protein
LQLKENKVPKRSEIPLEERNYSHIYFFLSALLALTTFWAVLDMIRIRAPWQEEQREFNRFEINDLKTKLAAAEEKFNTENAESYKQLESQLAQAKAQLGSAEYHQAQGDSAQADLAAGKARQQYRFIKSEADAEYYLFKEAEYHQGKESDEYKERGKKVEDLNAKAAEWKKQWDEAEVQKAAAVGRLADMRKAVANIQNQMKAMRAEIEGLKGLMARVEDRPIKIKQVVMADFVRGNFRNFVNNVDRCESCHPAATRKGFEQVEKKSFRTHPSLDTLLAIHPVERFGCSPCHEGQGPALQSVNFAHGFVKHWEHPLHHGKFISAGCNKCHGRELLTDHAEELNHAKRMVYELGCFGCHEIRGYETLERIGPNLNRLGHKLQPSFVYGWLRDNRAFRPHTRMPNPMFSDREALATTAYLYSIKDDGWEPVKKTLAGNAARGESLMETVGCKGCHVVKEEDRANRQDGRSYDIGPDLSTIALKASEEWVYDWVKNPKHFAPETQMPNLRLSDQEAADIAAYLMEYGNGKNLPEDYAKPLPDLNDSQLIAEGRALVRNFGCHGCHVIKGMENESRVSVSLNEFGAKTTEELFYGDALANKQVEKTWEGWTIGKLKNSRLYATEAVVQRMPNFQLSDADATTIAMLLKSWDGRVIGSSYLKPWHGREENIHQGRVLVYKYNCQGCHIIENRGGDIRPHIAAQLEKKGENPETATAMAPPNLIGEGEKTQSEWLFGFLKKPQTGQIRPWLQVRMPTFDLTDEEANDIVSYFKALDGDAAGFSYLQEYQLTAEQNAAAQKLVSTDYFSCFSCHQQGAKKPEGSPAEWAPDLVMARARLNPEWISKWLRDAQPLLPGTKMPSFYPTPDPDGPPDILGGDDEKQIIAIRNYLMSLGRGAAATNGTD